MSLLIGGVPTTPDPNTSAEASRYKWEAYRDTKWIYYFLPRGAHTFAKASRIAIEMGSVSRYFLEVSGSGVDLTLLI